MIIKVALRGTKKMIKMIVTKEMIKTIIKVDGIIKEAIRVTIKVVITKKLLRLSR